MRKETIKAQSLRLPVSVWTEVERYCERVGAVTLADALRRLLQAGLEAEKQRLRQE